MSENTENTPVNNQENQENSENIQPNSETPPEGDAPSGENNENAEDKGEEHADSEGEGGELPPLPEPDIAEDESKKKKEPPEWLKKKLERDRTAAEKKAAEAERLREENALLRAGKQANPAAPNRPVTPQPGVDPYMPQREQYNSDGEYFLALGDYRDNRRQAEAQFHARQAAIQEHEQKFQTGLKDAVESGKTKYKDFEERTDYILYGDGFPSNRAMAEAIVESPYKDDILYYLGTNIKEAERIAKSNPVTAAKEIAKIEVRFDSRKKSNITKAPKVLTPLTGGKGSATHGDPNKMGMDEFRQWYKDKFG